MKFSEQQEQKFQEIKNKYKFRQENFNEYRPKKYYIEPVNEFEFQKELAAIDNDLGQYKYHKELPRLSPHFLGPYRLIDSIQYYAAFSALISFFFGRMAAVELYGDYINENRIRIQRWKMFGLVLLPAALYCYIDQLTSPVNRGYQALQPYEVVVKNQLDRKLDLYKNVDKIINDDPYPTWDEFKLAQCRLRSRNFEAKIKSHQEF